MFEKVALEEALEVIHSFPLAPSITTETLNLFEAPGRVLAQDMTAQMDLPPFRRSPFDGYAFRAEDIASATQEAPVTLPIVHELAAGADLLEHLPRGTAAKILTGGPVPVDADTVIKFEDVTFTATTVTFTAPFGPKNVIMPGEDMKAGTLLGRKGDVLTGALLGLLAGQGIAQVEVYRRPKVTVLSNGSELLEPGIPRTGGRIYNSSIHLLLQYISDCGGEGVYGGIVEDDLDVLCSRLQDAVNSSDMVIMTGGASVGDYDYSLKAAQRLGAEAILRKAKYKPGGSMFAATLCGKPVLGLSGNPAAASVTMLLLGMPLLKRLSGQSNVQRPMIQV